MCELHTSYILQDLFPVHKSSLLHQHNLHVSLMGNDCRGEMWLDVFNERSLDSEIAEIKQNFLKKYSSKFSCTRTVNSAKMFSSVADCDIVTNSAHPTSCTFAYLRQKWRRQGSCHPNPAQTLSQQEQVTSLGGLSINIQNPIKCEKQISCVSRGRILIKQGSMFNTWKPMWVVLLEDGVEFYKRKADNSPKGMIPLKGSSIQSPCQDFGKRMFVFKLTVAKQQDHFFQAAYLEERDAWVRDIKKAIHRIDGGQRFARKSTRKSIRLPETINLSALYLSMKDPETGIKELKLEKDKRVFNHCFTGSCVIDWLVSSNSIRNRKEGLLLASSLLSEGYLQPAGDTSKAAAEGLSDTPFLDLSDAYYYFPDSGFFCEGYSSDDDVVLKEEFRGTIVKQGCLLKQGHRRKNWKVRKFVLRDDPAYLHYYDPAGGEEPLGAIHLRGCVVTAVEDMPDTKKYDVDNILFEIITANEIHYYLQAASSTERTEWIKAIQSVARTGK